MDNYIVMVLVVMAAVMLVMIFGLFALARQIGVLHTRLAPAGALMTTAGPKPGEKAPPVSLKDIHGGPVQVGGAAVGAQLVLFVSPTCPICKELVPVAKSVARDEHLSLVFASDGGEVAQHEAYIRDMKMEDHPYVVSLELGMKYEVGKLPYAVLIDEQGVLRSKGLVNSREHLESLVNSMQSGYQSIQEYLVKEENLGEQAS